MSEHSLVRHASRWRWVLGGEAARSIDTARVWLATRIGLAFSTWFSALAASVRNDRAVAACTLVAVSSASASNLLLGLTFVVSRIAEVCLANIVSGAMLSVADLPVAEALF